MVVSMNREDIIRMSREAGFEYSGAELSWESVICTEELERFAALVASAERERINDEAKAHLQELRNNFDAESAALRLHMWSQEKQA